MAWDGTPWDGPSPLRIPPTAPKKEDGIDATGEKPVASTVSRHFESHKFITKTKDAMSVLMNLDGFEPCH